MIDQRKTKDLTNEELQAYFGEHILYEIQHLPNTAGAILLKLSVPNGLQFVVVEAFAIHLRNLVCFFYPYKPQDTDVCAKDFFANEETWGKICPAESDLLKQARVRANKEVGHLTTARKNGTPDNKAWDVKGLTGELFPIVQLFVSSADKIEATLPPELVKTFDAIGKL